MTPVPIPIQSCAIADGDTIRACGGERIRLSGIDAPELPGHCRRGRDCAPGDPYAAKRALTRIIARGHVTIVRLGSGNWGRTAALVFVSGRMAQCYLLAGGYARYWGRYDRGGVVARECGL